VFYTRLVKLTWTISIIDWCLKVIRNKISFFKKSSCLSLLLLGLLLLQLPIIIVIITVIIIMIRLYLLLLRILLLISRLLQLLNYDYHHFHYDFSPTTITTYDSFLFVLRLLLTSPTSTATYFTPHEVCINTFLGNALQIDKDLRHGRLVLSPFAWVIKEPLEWLDWLLWVPIVRWWLGRGQTSNELKSCYCIIGAFLAYEDARTKTFFKKEHVANFMYQFCLQSLKRNLTLEIN
jgi:hypothetical protein